jgi:hypothetical protein
MRNLVYVEGIRGFEKNGYLSKLEGYFCVFIIWLKVIDRIFKAFDAIINRLLQYYPVIINKLSTFRG